MCEKSYKIVVVGDGGVGKTTWIKKYLTGGFEKKYIATLGVEVHCIMFYTSYGCVNLNVWDTAGQEKFGGLREGYYVNADGFIIMFDLCRPMTYKNADLWYQDITKSKHNNGNIVICGNKFDLEYKKTVDVTKFIDLGYKYCDISAKSGYNYETPFLELLRTLTKHDDLTFVSK